MSSPLLEELSLALEGYFATIQAQKSTLPPPLLPAMQHLDAVAARVMPEAEPMLRHYLEKKSYEKALKFIRGEREE